MVNGLWLVPVAVVAMCVGYALCYAHVWQGVADDMSSKFDSLAKQVDEAVRLVK